MRKYRIEVFDKIDFLEKNGLREKFETEYGYSPSFFKAKAYNISSSLKLDDKIKTIFYDQVTQDISISKRESDLLVGMVFGDESPVEISVSYIPGVTNNEANIIKKCFEIFNDEALVYTEEIYFVSSKDLDNWIHLLRIFQVNTLIQNLKTLKHCRFEEISIPSVQLSKFNKVEVFSDFSKLMDLSKDRCLALNEEECSAIENYYQDSGTVSKRVSKHLPSGITNVELEMIAQTWSEHCKHKIFNSTITYRESGLADEFKSLGDKAINGLYPEYIKNTTKSLKEYCPWLISVFSDNAGVVRFDSKVDICFKVETHNSPSALDPYGGAITGILGVNRDVLGCGLGFKPVANTDVFCFPDIIKDSFQHDSLPSNVIPPKRLIEGVHKGVVDGGNQSGIPTVNGAVYFDRSYCGKPLVFVGTLGVSPSILESGRSNIDKFVDDGDYIVMAGGLVGRDGIHGATFSSLELDENPPPTAVQIGDSYTQKILSDFLLEARDLNLFNCVTDNGAGGLSSSVGEMAEYSGGARIDLDKVPLKYPGLSPYEILISESQERMTFAVPKNKLDHFLKLAASYEVYASEVGNFTSSGEFEAFYNDEIICNLDLDFLHGGNPDLCLSAVWDGPRVYNESFNKKTFSEEKLQPETFSLATKLELVMGSLNVSSKKHFVSQYDSGVGGASLINSYTGEIEKGPNDAGLINLERYGGDKNNGVLLSCGLAPHLSELDPYIMAQQAFDEAIRNLLCSGGDLSTTAILDNFCWPDPILSSTNLDGDHKLGALVRSCAGLKDSCEVFSIPIISGKDSMKNDYKGISNSGDPVSVSVLPTLLVSAISKCNISNRLESHFYPGEYVFLLGNECGNLKFSEFGRLFKVNNTRPQYHNLEQSLENYRNFQSIIKEGKINSAHDVSDGGLICALLEACFGNQTGIFFDEEVDLSDEYLFDEGPGKIVFSTSKENVHFIKSVFGEQVTYIGRTTSDFCAHIDEEVIILRDLLKTWKERIGNELRA